MAAANSQTAELIRREQEARQAAELAAADVIARYPDDDALVDACGKLLDVFAPACLRIRTKQGGPLWPFVLNWIQLEYLRELRELFTGGRGDFFRGIRDLIVKPRQLGFSTFIAALFFMDGLLEPGRISVIVTHDEKISKELLRTYRLFYEELPEQVKAGTKLRTAAANAYEIEFDGIPEVSRFEIRTEKGNPWRGGTIHNLHASEAAFYEDYHGVLASYVQAVPASGNVIFETTCNGRNEFYEEVMLALAKATPYRVVFFEWFRHPEYRRPWNPDAEPPLSTEEQELVARHGLDLEQIAWRRFKISEVKDKFPQEYPETLLGAFLSTGRPFFDAAAVDRGHERAKRFWADVEAGKIPRPRTPRKHVTIYEDPIPGELYVLAADVAEGVDRGPGDGEKGGADFSSATMIHVASLREVATVHGRMPTVEFAEILNRLGRLYQAVLAPERNNHGHTVVASLQRAEYPELYHHAEYNEAGQKFLKAGWPTNVTTRPQMLDALDTVMRRDAFLSVDLGFWREADRFTRNEKTGKPEAMAGWHDDRIIRAAIAVYLCTMGRTAWGLDGNEGRDAAGFPRSAESYRGGVYNPSKEPGKRVDRIFKVAKNLLEKDAPEVAEPPKPKPSSWDKLRKAHAEAEVSLEDVVAKPTVIPGLSQNLSLSATAGQSVVEAIADRNRQRRRICGDCAACSKTATGFWCGTLRMRVLADDVACLSYALPEDEETDTGILESDFGGEQWT